MEEKNQENDKFVSVICDKGLKNGDYCLGEELMSSRVNISDDQEKGLENGKSLGEKLMTGRVNISDDQEKDLSYGYREKSNNNNNLSEPKPKKSNGKEYCGKGFDQKSNSNSKSKGKSECQICGKMFDSKKAVFGHMRIHSSNSNKRNSASAIHSVILEDFPIRKKRSSLCYNNNHNHNHVAVAFYEQVDEKDEDAASSLILLSMGFGINNNNNNAIPVEESSPAEDDDQVGKEMMIFFDDHSEIEPQLMDKDFSTEKNEEEEVAFDDQELMNPNKKMIMCIDVADDDVKMICDYSHQSPTLLKVYSRREKKKKDSTSGGDQKDVSAAAMMNNKDDLNLPIIDDDDYLWRVGSDR